jgi:hypothetical protein
VVDTGLIAAATGPGMPDSERLARRWFAAIERGDFDEIGTLLHEDVRLVSRVQPGVVAEGRSDVARFIQNKVANRLYQAVAEVYTPLDESRVVVEGRMRWIDDDRVIRDDPVVWALEFRDELLFQFLPARTPLEAESSLSSER